MHAPAAIRHRRDGNPHTVSAGLSNIYPGQRWLAPSILRFVVAKKTARRTFLTAMHANIFLNNRPSQEYTSHVPSRFADPPHFQFMQFCLRRNCYLFRLILSNCQYEICNSFSGHIYECIDLFLCSKTQK